MNIRPSVRLRLTLLYGGLFLLTGALLLVVNYGLVRSRLPGGPFRVEVPGGAHDAIPLEPESNFVPVAPPGDVVREGPFPPDSPEGQRIQAAFERSAQEFRSQTMRELVTQSGVALGLMAVFSVGLGWVVAGRVLRPLHQITATARRLSEENLHERIGLEGPQDELKELADTFDAMLGRLDGAFESQRRFIANASHELRTPLAIQRTLVDVALADPNRSALELAAVADDLRAAIDRSERLIDGLLLLARSERQVERWEQVDMAAAAADAVSAVSAEAAARGVRVDVEAAPGVVVRGDPALVERAVANLVENAVRHNVGNGWAKVTASVVGGGGGVGAVAGGVAMARLCVVNTGPVVDESELPQLFEPFRRLHDRTASADGTGLGLSIVRSVTDMHNGAVHARPRAGGGLEVELLLPLAP